MKVKAEIVEKIKQTKEKYEKELLSKRNVVGVGIGFKRVKGKKTKALSIIVNVARKVSVARLLDGDIVPSLLEDIKTDVVEVGEIRALVVDPTQKFRPAPGGVSIGHKDITAGTLGVNIDKYARRYILSNNHVLANSNEGEIGDSIYQPGPVDGGNSDDTIGWLDKFVPIEFETTSCAIAKLYAWIGNIIAKVLGSRFRFSLTFQSRMQKTNLVDCALAASNYLNDLNLDILEIGRVSGTVEAFPGMKVRKFGRTTCLNEGEVQQIGVTIQVSYGGNKIATFTDQIITSSMAQGGDSGSLVVERNGQRAVGLLFAGSDEVTILNRISNVEEALDIQL